MLKTENVSNIIKNKYITVQMKIGTTQNIQYEFIHNSMGDEV